MSVLNTHPIEPDRLADLRAHAASRLTGAAATKGPIARSADALAVLHALASSPETAPAALSLLHELQVHQVEIDLQAQELIESRAELESALRRQIELHDHQPVGCFSTDVRGVLQALNQTGAGMLGKARDQAQGLPLDGFFGPESALRFRSAMASLGAGVVPPPCVLQLRPDLGDERPVLASFGIDPTVGLFLVNLAESAAVAGGPPGAG